MKDHLHVCSLTCNGVTNSHGLCCSGWAGCHYDVDEFLDRLSKYLGITVSKDEIFVEYEEGKNFQSVYKEHYWRNENAYPTLRVDTSLPNYPCIFYDVTNKRCNIYEIRPRSCKEYECDFLKEQKLIQLKKGP